MDKRPQTTKGACIVVGAGDATGGAITRRFALEGYHCVPVRRSAEKLKELTDRIQADGGKATPVACDARKEEQVIALFDRVEAEIGSNRSGGLQYWRQCAFSLYGN